VASLTQYQLASVGMIRAVGDDVVPPWMVRTSASPRWMT
jgi:hypothetical protein